MQMPTTTTTKSKGCGCGCGGGCGGCAPARLPETAPASCSPCESAAFVRPRFFAGQLLTEDDLGALVDYVVQKQRFHNARLFGAGVVCGLSVRCGPCDSTQIVVEPGYAIDCCGNDLVSNCERVLDLAPLIRDLQARLKGSADCTDPCGQPRAHDDVRGRGDERKVQQYCLYARYAERPDQPVAAYPVGDDCDAARCEPTRIVEGIVFELRCPPKEHGAKTLRQAQKECEDRYGKQELAALGLAAARVAHQRPAGKTDDQLYAELGEFEPTRFEASIAKLPAAEQLVARTQALAMIAPLLVRAQRDGRELPYETAPLSDYASEISGQIVNSEAASAPTYLDRVFALKLAESWRSTRARKAGAGAARIVQLAEGVIWDEDIARASDQHLAVTLAKLQKLAGCFGTVHTDCELRETIDRLQIHDGPGEANEYERKAGRLDQASAVIERLLNDCKCAAFNPPCAPCDDPGVLLACFEVDGCKVVRICNTVRPYVLAPSTLRYWGFGSTFDAITERCCGRVHEPKEPYPGEPPAPPAEPPPAPQPVDVIKLAATRSGAALYERLALEPAPRAEVEVRALRDELAALKQKLQRLETKLQGRDK